MKSRIFCFIAIFVGTLAFYVLAIPVSSVEPTTSTTQENIDCTNPNFKTYIYCLKRLKRHHHHNDDPNHGEYDEICKTSCMKKCEYERSISDCQDYCSYCLRRTKHKQQVITETEYETESAKPSICKNNTDCEVHPKDSKPFNVTIIVDVNTSSANGSSSVSPPVVFLPFPPYAPFPPYPTY
ncbi:uncharacterized protein LOC128887709, partial [Hylaeus anthracinus]|uniref:uncharacterized protein LOC128887709 n=1 Tax=Hylaeus anthracinus TaxID=313031 RepID=UPI0023B9BB12